MNNTNFDNRKPQLPMGFQFTYDLGDQPDEDDDEINNTDGEEEGEEEPDDILIVEGDDEDMGDCDEDDDMDSPSPPQASGTNKKMAMKGGDYRAVSNCSSAEKQAKVSIGGGISPTNKSMNISQIS